MNKLAVEAVGGRKVCCEKIASLEPESHFKLFKLVILPLKSWKNKHEFIYLVVHLFDMLSRFFLALSVSPRNKNFHCKQFFILYFLPCPGIHTIVTGKQFDLLCNKRLQSRAATALSMINEKGKKATSMWLLFSP